MRCAAARDLFDGRAWVVVPTAETDPAVTDAVAAVAALGRGRGQRARARASTTPPSRPSPTCRSSRPASWRRGCETLDEPAVALAGQGLRDVTRIAASDPQLWTQILAGQRRRRARRARRTSRDRPRPRSIGALDELARRRRRARAPAEALARAIAAGQRRPRPHPRQARAAPTAYATVRGPRPRRARRSWAGCSPTSGDAGVNIEDLHLEHGLGQPFGLAEVDVVPAAADGLGQELEHRGWRAARLRPPLG